MDAIFPLISAFFAGVGIGLIYFGGLWLTAQRLSEVRRPMLLAVGSFLLRTLSAMTAFFVVMAGKWIRLIPALLGFLVMRTFLLYWLRLSQKNLRQGR
ncbi:MAG: ATP synthase subunit I [Anaerolineae bacterium]